MQDTLELIDLEHLLNDEVHCQAAHHYTTCSVEVVYIVSDCLGKIFVCKNTVDDPDYGTAIRRLYQRCKYCRRNAIDCWDFWPV